MVNEAVLLLNSTYEPLNVINVRRALRLLVTSKATSLENNGHIIRAANREIPQPQVVRLVYYVKRPIQRVKFTKRSVLSRDRYTCQYCGDQSLDLTLDHVVPKHKKGETVWNNVVAACKRCNADKGGRSLKDSGMKLVRPPKEPRFLPYLRMVRTAHQMSWDKYLFLSPDNSYLLREELPKIATA